MRRPTAAELLATWDAGAGGTWTTRALLLVSLAHPRLTSDDVLRLSIGDRDSRIYRTRQLLFGPRLDCVADCPACGESLQTSLSAEEVLGSGAGRATGSTTVHSAGHEVAFRLPTSADLIALGPDLDPDEAERRLLHACILEASSLGKSVVADVLPAAVLDAVSEGMAEVDPCADIRLRLECPACSHRWEATFDIVSHVWYEIHAWALRVLEDVHALARAYGWREADILRMSEQRRRAYLDLVGT
jgi:hypothetical protein